MTIERWNDDRLDRLANTVESMGYRIDGLADRLDTITKIAESNASVIQALANVAAEAREEREQLFRKMDQQQEQIIGLRIETIRLLDLLLNQRNQGDNPSN